MLEQAPQAPLSPQGPTAAMPGDPTRREDTFRPARSGGLLLLKPLARGGMGEVYLAALGDIPGAERPCVVKLIRREHRDDASFLARFLDEARIQAQMQHPGVAQVLEAAMDADGQPYVVVEYVPGRDLAELQAHALRVRCQVFWPDAVAIGVAVAEALAHVHERTGADGRPLLVAHRDLSPQNIMVSYSGDIKLIDFGTARGENRQCQTVNGIVFAKPGYVAPEVAANIPATAAADLYALGIVLWELIASRRFLQGDSRQHLAAVAKGERHPDPLAPWLGVPAALDTIIARLTATKVSDRYESARVAMEALQGLLKQAPGQSGAERGVRARIGQLMLRLYPQEPAQSRAEFADLVAAARERPEEAPTVDSTGRETPSLPADFGLLPGTRYKLTRRLSESPTSAVYEAHHIDLKRTVALKILHPRLAGGPSTAAQFQREAEVMAKMRHDNIVMVHDFGSSSDGLAFYTMEFLEGQPLDQLLAARGHLPWQEAVEVALQACAALEAVHELGIVHRDIKPGNLMLTSTGVVKLLDFGIKHEATDPAESAHSGISALRVVGTPEYMAPEQLEQRQVDARADIYALGAVLYELLCGRPPHAGNTTVELLAEKTRVAPLAPSLAKATVVIPGWLDRLVVSMLEQEPRRRPPKIQAVREYLQTGLRREEGQRGKRRLLGYSALALTFIGVTVTLGVGVGRTKLPNPLGGSSATLALEEGTRAARRALLALVPETSQSAAPSRELTRHPLAKTVEVGPEKPNLAPPAAPTPMDRGTGQLTVDASGTRALTTAVETRAPTPLGTRSDSHEARESPAAARRTPVAEVTAPAQAVMAGSRPPAATPVEPREPTAPVGGLSPRPPKSSEPAHAAGVPTAPLPTLSPSGLPGQLAALEALLAAGKKTEALEGFRSLAKTHPRSGAVLQGWLRSASAAEWWGEAIRIAETWASIEPTEQSLLALAQTQRRIGRTEAAIDTLSDLLTSHPSNLEAQKLMKSLSGNNGTRPQ